MTTRTCAQYLRHLLGARYEVHAVADGRQALEATRLLRPALVLADVMMPQLDGFGLLRAIRDDSALASMPVILLSARAGEESRVEGLQAGADDYLVKPFTARELLARVEAHLKWPIFAATRRNAKSGCAARRNSNGRNCTPARNCWSRRAACIVTSRNVRRRSATLKDRLYRENLALRDEVDRTSMFEEIVGSSETLKIVLSRIAKVAPTDSTVLIAGETGTGKELIARAVHKRSQRSGRAFVSVNCAALAPTLISSELFGHERGAFTGATHGGSGVSSWLMAARSSWTKWANCCPRRRSRSCVSCKNGNSSESGARSRSRIDVRVIAATNRDLAAAAANGSFRQDLFYRLNVFPIEVPPLRERQDDILMLVEYFVQRYATRAGKNIRSIDKKTLDLLQAYDWPGNIRELQNVIERSVILSSGEVFAVDESWLPKQSVPTSTSCCGVGRSSRRVQQRAGDHRSRARRVPRPSRRVVRSCGEARRSTVHARPSHQGVEHQQGAIQVSLKPASITRFTTSTRFSGFTSSQSTETSGFAARFGELRVASGLPLRLRRQPRAMTCRIDRLSIEQRVVLRISGRIAGEDLEVLRTALAEGRVVAIELAEVELVDRAAVKFLALNEANGIELRHCPAYIREWVTRERGRS